MLKEINFGNYTSLYKRSISLKPITVFCGYNGAGKTNIIRSPLLIKQISADEPDGVALDGTYIQTESFKDMVFENANLSIGYTFTLSKADSGELFKKLIVALDLTGDISYCDVSLHLELVPRGSNTSLAYAEILESRAVVTVYSRKASSRYVFGVEFIKGYKVHLTVDNEEFNISIIDLDTNDKSRKLVAVYNIIRTLFNSVEFGNVDYTYSRYPKYGDIKNLLREYGDKNISIDSTGINSSLKNAMVSWIKHIGVGSVSVENGELFLNERALYKCGTGICNVVPIVFAGLNHVNSGTIIFEQPETGIHPRMLLKLVDLMLLAVKCGKQVIIETNSEHIIHKVIRRVLEHNINKDFVGLYYVRKNEDGISDVIPMEIDDWVGLEESPDGVLDTFNHEAEAIFNAGYANMQMEKRGKEG